MQSTSFALVSVALALATSGCCHQYHEAQKAAFANQVAEQCAAAQQRQPQQIIILPAGAQTTIVRPPGPAAAPE